MYVYNFGPEKNPILD